MSRADRLLAALLGSVIAALAACMFLLDAPPWAFLVCAAWMLALWALVTQSE